MKKRKTAMLCAMLLAAAIPAGCSGGGNSGVTKPAELDPKDFVSEEKFITIADLPPNPFENLETYASLGFSGYILTQDYCDFTRDGKITDSYKNAIKRAGKSGLDVYIRNHYNDPDYFVNDDDTTLRGQFGAGETSGNTYTLPKRNITTEFKEFSAVKGFYMADEPVYDNLFAYGKLIDWYNTYYSDSYFHMNLFPSYATAKSLAYRGYNEYVNAYITEIAAKVKGKKSICLDNYPFANDSPNPIRPSYFSDLLMVARAAKDYNASAPAGDEGYMGICIQTFKNPGISDITSAAQISFQLCTGMAVGAKVFEYFSYNSAANFGIYGIMQNGNKRIYDYVKEANDGFLGFAEVVNAFEWQGVRTFTAAESKKSENEESFAAISDLLVKDTGVLDCEKSSSRLDTLVGCFKKGKSDGYMVVNCSDPSKEKINNVTMSFKNCTEALVYTEGMKVEKVKLADGCLRLTLGAGKGAFIIPA